jgi:hypothetical protein
MDEESLQSSKGFPYVEVDTDGSCCGRYQATTGYWEHGNRVNNRLHEGALQFLANHFGTRPASPSSAVHEEGNACHSVLQISSEYKFGNGTFRAHRQKLLSQWSMV